MVPPCWNLPEIPSLGAGEVCVSEDNETAWGMGVGTGIPWRSSG